MAVCHWGPGHGHWFSARNGLYPGPHPLNNATDACGSACPRHQDAEGWTCDLIVYQSLNYLVDMIITRTPSNDHDSHGSTVISASGCGRLGRIRRRKILLQPTRFSKRTTMMQYLARQHDRRFSTEHSRARTREGGKDGRQQRGLGGTLGWKWYFLVVSKTTNFLLVQPSALCINDSYKDVPYRPLHFPNNYIYQKKHHDLSWDGRGQFAQVISSWFRV